MPVIALTQEMGSLAKDVALRLAEVAGLGVMRNEVVENVADRMQVAPSLIRRLREGKAGLVERLSMDKQQVALYSAEEVLAPAAQHHVAALGLREHFLGGVEGDLALVGGEALDQAR
ncbi:MAG: cytidylate kinase family protein, partial [Ramlibacter sp.]